MNERRVAGTIAGAAGLIAVVTLLARGMGLARIVAFADAVRAGGVGEIYQAVNALPNVLFEVAAGGVLAAVAVPLIAQHLGAGATERADRLANTLLTWVLVLLIPAAVLLLVLADPLTAFLIEARDAQSHRVGALLLRIFAIQVPLYGVGIVLTGVLQAHRRFLAAALAPLLSSIVVLASYLWYGSLTGGATSPSEVSDSALQVLGWGTTAGVVALSLPLIGPALRAGWRYRPSLSLDPADRRRIGALAGAGLVALFAQQLCVLAVLWLCGHAADSGVLPVQQYVQAVYLLPYAVLAVPVATSVFPALAHAAGAGEERPDLVARALRGVILLTGLAAGVLMATAPAIGGFFTALDARRGSAGASPEALGSLPVGLVTYAPGLVGFGVAALLTRALYVRGTPLLAGVAVALGWLVAAGLPFLLGATGASATSTLRLLGMASSLGMTVSALLLALLVRQRWGGDALAGVGRSLGTVVVAMAAAVAVGSLVQGSDHTPAGIGPSLTQGLTVGLAASVAGLVVLAIGDREQFAAAVRRGRARRRG